MNRFPGLHAAVPLPDWLPAAKTKGQNLKLDYQVLLQCTYTIEVEADSGDGGMAGMGRHDTVHPLARPFIRSPWLPAGLRTADSDNGGRRAE